MITDEGVMRDASPAAEHALGFPRSLLLWLLFFLVLFGLGYPTLNRYDPRKLGPDQQSYYNMVLGRATLDNDLPFCFRVLVPELAKPFYMLGNGRVRSWDPVLFGLLISNCIFGATSALLLLLIALRTVKDLTLALLGCTLYLLNHVVHNLWLAAMVDSSEACLMLCMTWALFNRRWWLLPFLGVPGAIAKQSFLPFALFFSAVWWFTEARQARGPRRDYRPLAWIAALGVTGGLSLTLVYWLVSGQLVTPVAVALSWDTGGNFAGKLLHEFTDQNLWYVFGWLLPLGVWRLNRLPRPWVMASAATALLVVGVGASADLMGTVNRPLFSVIGPLLSLSTAILIAERPSPKAIKQS